MHRAFRGLTILAAGYLLALAVYAVWFPGAVKRHQIESAAFILAAVWFAAVVALPATERSSSPVVLRDRPFWMASVLVALIAAASTWRTLSVGSLSDDFVIESWARAGHLLGDEGWFARPLVVVLWKGVFATDGGARTLHALNVALHAINGVLVVALARRVGADLAGAAAAGIVFVLWPTQIEPVFWTAGMFDVLMTTGVLAALLLTAPGAGVRQLAAGLLLVAGALLSKETAVVLPALWLICYAPRPFLDRSRRVHAIVGVAALAAACGLYFVWRAWLRLPLTGGTHLTRYVIKEQISRTFAGLGLPLTAETTAAHPYLPILLLFFFLTMLVGFVWTGSSRQTAARGLVWAVVAGAPTIGYLFIGPDLDGSRYLYLPAVGFSLFVGTGVVHMARQPRPVRVVVLAMSAAVAVVVLVEQQRLAGQWVRAGQERDALLAAAAAASSNHACGDVSFSGLPARYRGAQLFNNGFPEAFARARGSAPGVRTCRLKWTPAGFEFW